MSPTRVPYISATSSSSLALSLPPNKTQLHAQRRLISSSNNQDNKDKLPLICYCCSNELLNEKLSEIIGKVYVLKNDSQEPLLRLISPRQDTTINMQITDYAVL